MGVSSMTAERSSWFSAIVGSVFVGLFIDCVFGMCEKEMMSRGFVLCLNKERMGVGVGCGLG
jgi:hypothetical protein